MLGTTIRQHDGSERFVPRQMCIYSEADRAAMAAKLVAEGDYGSIKVQAGDIVIAASDGITDNLPGLVIQQKLREMVNQGLGPKDMAEILVAGAIAANLKPDDISVVVALVQ